MDSNTPKENNSGGTLPSSDLVEAAREFMLSKLPDSIQRDTLYHEYYEWMAAFAAEQLATRWTAIHSEDDLPSRGGNYLVSSRTGHYPLRVDNLDPNNVSYRGFWVRHYDAWCELPPRYVQPEKEEGK